MAPCTLLDSCFFYNEQLVDMPHTTEYLREKYCNGDFPGCARYMIATSHGPNYVPKYLYPNDMFMVLSADLIEAGDASKEEASMVNVIYSDGTFGTVPAAVLDEMVAMEGVAAYQRAERWTEVRRKSDVPYPGADRRKAGRDVLFVRY